MCRKSHHGKHIEKFPGVKVEECLNKRENVLLLRWVARMETNQELKHLTHKNTNKTKFYEHRNACFQWQWQNCQNCHPWSLPVCSLRVHRKHKKLSDNPTAATALHGYTLVRCWFTRWVYTEDNSLFLIYTFIFIKWIYKKENNMFMFMHLADAFIQSDLQMKI